MFINELIPHLAKLFYKRTNTISSESRLTTELLFPCLSRNLANTMQDSNSVQNNTERPRLNNIETKTEAIENFFKKWGGRIENLGLKISAFMQNKLLKLYNALNTLSEKEAEEDNQEIIEMIQIKDKISIEWDKICEIIVKTIKETLENDKKSKSLKFVKKVRIANFSNFSTIFFKFLEHFQLSALAFKRNKANWQFIGSPLAVASDILTVENNPYTLYIFWFTFCLNILYAVLAFNSIEEISRGQSGLDENGVKAKFFS